MGREISGVVEMNVLWKMQRHCERSEAIHLLPGALGELSQDGSPRRLRLLAMTGGAK